MTGMEQEMQ
jgi:hypothetical protein